MKKVKILNEYDYQTYPFVEGMIEVSETDLENIGKTKKFDVENQRVIDIEADELEEIDDVEIEDDELQILKQM